MDAGASPDSIPSLDEGDLRLLANGVRIIAMRSLGDPDAAADVVQETLARAIRAVAEGRLRDHRALGGFVRSIARHVIADELRSRSRTVPLDPNLHTPSVESDPLNALVHDDRVAAVRAAIETLSARDRRVIELSFVEGLTPAAVAERLGEPRARVRKRKSRALERLREALAAGHRTATSPTLVMDDDAASELADPPDGASDDR